MELSLAIYTVDWMELSFLVCEHLVDPFDLPFGALSVSVGSDDNVVLVL